MASMIIICSERLVIQFHGHVQLHVIINLLAIALIYRICKYVFRHRVSHILSAYTFFLEFYLQFLAKIMWVY